jgi:hypothetical protein
MLIRERRLYPSGEFGVLPVRQIVLEAGVTELVDCPYLAQHGALVGVDEEPHEP